MKEQIEQQIQVMLEEAEKMEPSEFRRGYMSSLVNLWQHLMSLEIK